jgi:hypothetical protein
MASSGGSSNLILLGAVAVGGYFLYQWYFVNGLPADAVYVFALPVGSTVQVPSSFASAGAAPTGPATTQAGYIYYSPSNKLFYASYTAPTATQTQQGQALMTSSASGSANTPITSNTPAATPTPAPVTPAATPASTPSGPSLDSLYTQLKTSATGDANFTGSGDALSGTPYHWQFYVNALEPGNTLNLTTAFPGVDLTQPMTAATFWAGAGPALGAEYGLTGYGLGMYAGLGDYLSHRGSPYGWRN